MLKPAAPPMRKVGSDGFNRTAAEDTGFWVQSSTAPLATEVRFNCRTRLVPMSFTASTPWSCALPRDACNPVYLRTSDRLEYEPPAPRDSRAVNTPRSRVPAPTLKPTAWASLLEGSVTEPKAPLPESVLRLAPLPMNSLAWVIAMANKSPLSVETPEASVTVTPVTRVRLTLMVALP